MLILSATDIRRALPMRAAIDSQKKAYASLATGNSVLPLRTPVTVPTQNAVTLFMPARVENDLGVKIVSVFPKNIDRKLPMIHGVVILIDSENGVPIALMDATYLTALRTGAGAGAATELLARPDSKIAAIIGSGTQARTQLLAICEVRPISETRIYSRDSHRISHFVEDMQPQVKAKLIAAASPREAITDADIVCAATTSLTPVFDGRDLKASVHVNGVGAYTLQMKLDDVIGRTFYQPDGLCDPNGVVMGYISAARRLGAKAIEDSEVVAIEKLDDKGFNVHTARGGIPCEILVNAAGPWSAPLSRMVGIHLPVTPLRRQILTTTPLPEVPQDFPFVIDFAQSLYFHREGEGLLTGMSNPNEKAGFDQSVDEAFELINLEAASKRLPLLEKAGLASHWAGLYEVTPDAHPIIGRVSENYFVVAGFSGHGFMHGPASGLLLSEEILDGKAHTLDISSLSYTRFEEGKLIKEYNVI